MIATHAAPQQPHAHPASNADHAQHSLMNPIWRPILLKLDRSLSISLSRSLSFSLSPPNGVHSASLTLVAGFFLVCLLVSLLCFSGELLRYIQLLYYVVAVCVAVSQESCYGTYSCYITSHRGAMSRHIAADRGAMLRPD